MAETERTLNDDVYDWLRHAKELLGEDQSDEALSLVHEHLEAMHKILQEGQYQADRRMEEQLRYERAEVDRFRERLNLVEGGDDNDFTTTHDDLVSLWTSLLQNEWPEAFHALRTNKKLKEKEILDKLTAILTKSYTLCRQRVTSQRDEIMYRAKFPGTNRRDKTHQLPKDLPEELVEPSKYCQEKTVQFCIDTIKGSICQEMKQDRDLLKISKTKTDPGKTAAMERYLIKCVEFSWIASLEHAPVHLISNRSNDCKRLLAHFPDHELVSSKKRYVKWPALVQDGVMVPWGLYTPGKDDQVPRSKDALIGVARAEEDEPIDNTNGTRTYDMVDDLHTPARYSDRSREVDTGPGQEQDDSGSNFGGNARVVEESGSRVAAQRPDVNNTKKEKAEQTKTSASKDNKETKKRQTATKTKHITPPPAGIDADERKRNIQTIDDI